MSRLKSAVLFATTVLAFTGAFLGAVTGASMFFATPAHAADTPLLAAAGGLSVGSVILFIAGLLSHRAEVACRDVMPAGFPVLLKRREQDA
jgi:predicted membrane protein